MKCCFPFCESCIVPTCQWAKSSFEFLIMLSWFSSDKPCCRPFSKCARNQQMARALEWWKVCRFSVTNNLYFIFQMQNWHYFFKISQHFEKVGFLRSSDSETSRVSLIHLSTSSSKYCRSGLYFLWVCFIPLSFKKAKISLWPDPECLACEKAYYIILSCSFETISNKLK